jgi:hypothetical protein
LFFSQAAQYMIEKNDNLELLKKINSAVDGQNEDDVQIERQKNIVKRNLPKNGDTTR